MCCWTTATCGPGEVQGRRPDRVPDPRRAGGKGVAAGEVELKQRTKPDPEK